MLPVAWTTGLCCSQSLKAGETLAFIYIYGFILCIKVQDLVCCNAICFFGFLPSIPLLWAILKIWFLSQGRLQKLLTAVFGVNEMAKPPVDPLNGSERAEWARRMRVMGLTSWSGECAGAPRTESPLCYPGWNFVLEKSLTFLNPNCTQWGVSSFPLPSQQSWRGG